ncbi:MAG TPA: tetratricopeptide repeat protein [bacterium (Candidatus Stahlbacteria)]|nr:tetratricopeptide repeat protein [Candidatus Stahlbacteria bacterium]
MRRRKKDYRRDQFVDTIEKVLKWGLSHRDRAITIIIAIIAGVVIGYSVLTPKENFNPQAELILFQVKELIGIGKFEEAQQLLNYLVQNFGTTSSGSRGHYYLGVIHSSAGRYNEAIKEFSLFLSSIPKSYFLIPSAHIGRGGAKEELGDLDGAYEDYKKAAESNTPLAQIGKIEMARVASLLGRKEEAEAILKKVIEEEPGTIIGDDARLLLGYLKARD